MFWGVGLALGLVAHMHCLALLASKCRALPQLTLSCNTVTVAHSMTATSHELHTVAHRSMCNAAAFFVLLQALV